MVFIVFSLELIIYFFVTVFISIKLLDAKYTFPKLCASFLLCMPMIILPTVTGLMDGLDDKTIALFYLIFQFAEIIIIRLFITKISTFSVAGVYYFIDLLTVIIVNTVELFTPYDYNLQFFIELGISLIVFALCTLVCFSRLRSTVRNIINWTPRVVKIIMFSVLICSSFLCVLVVNQDYYANIEAVNRNIRIILVLLILAMSCSMPVLMAYSMTNQQIKKQAESFEKQIQLQSEQYSLLSRSDQEMRRFRHDYKNMCIGLNKLISEGRNDEALKMLEEQNTSFNNSILRYNTGNGIVDALLTDKQKQAEKINTTIEFEGAVPPSAVSPNALCIIFGNTIDNAIEACAKKKTEEPKVITVSCICSSGFIFIKIINPVDRKVEFNGRFPATTKQDKTMHGFGLNSLTKTVKEYDGEVDFESSDEQFLVSVELNLSA